MEDANVLIALKMIYQDLFEQEKKAADYILRNYNLVANMSVTELSEKMQR